MGAICLSKGNGLPLSTGNEQLPQDILDEEKQEDGERFLRIPPTADMLAAAQSHAQSVFKTESMTLDEVRIWTNKNPFITAILCSQWGQYLGYFDVLPLTESGETRMVSGLIEEREISSDDVFAPEEMSNAKTLYVAGIAVKGMGTELGKNRAAAMLVGLANYIEYFYGVEQRRIIAVAATPAGEQILKRVNARICCLSCNRKDGHDLYEFYFTPQLYEQVMRVAKRRADPPRIESVAHPIWLVDPSLLHILTGSTADSYYHIKTLEDTLRRCLVQELSKITDKWWKQRIPNDTRENSEKRMEGAVQKEPWKTKEAFKPVDFLDFTDYEKVILRNDNWKEAFKPIFHNKEYVQLRMSELVALRNSIMHGRELTWDDKQKVSIFCKELLRPFAVHEDLGIEIAGANSRKPDD